RLRAGAEVEGAPAARGPHPAGEEARGPPGERSGAEAHLFPRAGGGSLEEENGAPPPPPPPPHAARPPESEGGATLLCGDGEEAWRHALPEGRAPAPRIIALGALDLDHVRAHVGEDLRGDGSGQILRDLDDGDALERKCHPYLHLALG